ncbi:MAG: hypothetical protein M0Z73_02585 [Betaproteobacteria bacterium]|nr:hypothetical protein [Betaproteobacteria bacterium]
MKRNPSNTITEQAKTFSDVRRKLVPPSTLSKAALPFWESIAATRAPGEWAPADIPIAAQLAEDYALLASLRERLDAEGWFAKGKLRPEAALLDTVSRRAFSASRLLQLHPRGRTGQQSRSVVAKRRAAQNAAMSQEEFEDDYLIPTH